MRDSRLILILSSLSFDELREFGKYLNSPLHNTNKTIVRFFNLIKRHHPEYTSRALTMEHIHKKIFPSKKYNPAVIRNVISEMTHISEEFLAYLEFYNDAFSRKKFLLNQLDSRKLEKLFEKHLKDTFQYLESSKVRDEFYFFNKYQLQNIKRNFYDRYILAGERETVDKILPEIINNLTYAFIITFLKEYFTYTSVKKFFEIEYRHKFFDVLIKHISKEKDSYKEVPLIFILFIFLSIFTDKKEEELTPRLKELIDSNKELMSPDDFRNFYIELYNHYKNQQLIGDKSYGRKSFELMKEMLKENIFIQEDNYMSAHAYTNIVHAAVRVNELDWAENFLNEYKNKLPVHHRENAYIYSSAVVNLKKGLISKKSYKRKKYLDIALEYLAKVKNDDYFYMLRIKNMQIHIHCELKEYELAKKIIEGYKQYLSKKNIIPHKNKARYANYIRFTKELIKLSICCDGFALQQLKKQVTETKMTEYRGWLLKKIDELETSAN